MRVLRPNSVSTGRTDRELLFRPQSPQGALPVGVQGRPSHVDVE